MISRFKDFIKISFVQDVSILEIGKFFSILFGIASSVILARLLHPELYGVYGLIFAFVGLVGTFMSWGGDFASLTLLSEAYAKKDKQEVKNILTYFVKVTLLAICIIGILSIFLAPFLTDLLYNNSQIGNWAKIVLLAGFLTIAYSLLIIILQATRKIKELTVLEIFNKFTYTLFPIIFVLLGFGLTGIVWGHFISAFIFLVLAIFLYYFLIKKDDLLPNLSQIFSNFRKIEFKKYFNFGFLIAVDKNLGRLASLLPVIFLGIFASMQDVSYFKIALGYILIPSMILEPISRLLTVQLPKSKSYNSQILKEHFYKTALYSGLISILLAIPFVVLAPYLIKLFYGMEYIPSIQLVYYLSVLIIFSGFGVGLGAFYRTVNRMKISITINICYTISVILLIFILIKFYNPLIAIVSSLVICAILSLLFHFYIIRKIFKKYEKN